MLNIYTNPVFYQHDTGAGHPESARRMDAALAGVERAGLVARVSRDTGDHPDTDRIIAKVHSADYERALEQAARAGLRDFVSGDNPMTFSMRRCTAFRFIRVPARRTKSVKAKAAATRSTFRSRKASAMPRISAASKTWSCAPSTTTSRRRSCCRPDSMPIDAIRSAAC